MVIHTLECPIFLLFSIILFRNDKQTFIFQKDILHGLLGIFGLNMLAHVQKKAYLCTRFQNYMNLCTDY